RPLRRSVTQAALAQGRRCGRRGALRHRFDERAAPDAGGDEARGLELGVRARDRVAVRSQLLREHARRRQLVPRRKRAALDAGHHLVEDLTMQRLLAPRVELDADALAQLAPRTGVFAGITPERQGENAGRTVPIGP